MHSGVAVPGQARDRPEEPLVPANTLPEPAGAVSRSLLGHNDATARGTPRPREGG